MKTTLFYDPDITGHHCEYLHHPAAFLANQEEIKGIIVCNAKIGENLKLIYGESAQLQIVNISEERQRQIDGAKSLWHRGRADAECFAHYIQLLEPDLAVALHANPLQPFFNFGCLKQCKARLRGILFDPYPLRGRMSTPPTWKWHLTALRKRLQIKWLSRNPRVEKMFILNDATTAAYFNSIVSLHSRYFEAIPDPLPIHLMDTNIASGTDQDLGIYRMLFIGSINRRKGLLETLNALELLPDSLKQRVALRIVGRFSNSELRLEAIVKVDLLSKRGYQIECCEGWVSDQDFAREMATCDLVLAPYVGFHGSSGIIGHAAFFAKPLLATCDGLVGEIVTSRNIGEVVQTQDAEQYAAAIEGFIKRGWCHSDEQALYAREMDSTAFMRQLIN